MSSRRRYLKEDAQLRIMRLINDDPELTSRQIAEKVGISNGSAYYVLTALIQKGFVKLENFNRNPRKRQYAYLLTPKGIREKSILTLSFIERKKQEFEKLRAEIRSMEEEAGLVVDDEFFDEKGKISK